MSDKNIFDITGQGVGNAPFKPDAELMKDFEQWRLSKGKVKKGTVQLVQEVFNQSLDLMAKKNSDYGDAWREMRLMSITDQIAVKVKRIKRLEDLKLKAEAPQVSEGLEAEYRDIMNYCAFALVRLAENE